MLRIKQIVGVFFMIARVENHKRNVLEQCDQEQEIIFEELRKKKVAQGQTMDRIKAQLLVSLFPVACAFNCVIGASHDLQACIGISAKYCFFVH